MRRSCSAPASSGVSSAGRWAWSSARRTASVRAAAWASVLRFLRPRILRAFAIGLLRLGLVRVAVRGWFGLGSEARERAGDVPPLPTVEERAERGPVRHLLPLDPGAEHGDAGALGRRRPFQALAQPGEEDIAVADVAEDGGQVLDGAVEAAERLGF